MGLSSGRFAVTRSPEEAPARRRLIQGARCCPAQRRSAPRASSQGLGAGIGGTSNHSSSTPTPRASSTCAATRRCPAAERCRRSALHSSGLWKASSAKRSIRMAPCRSASSRSAVVERGGPWPDDALAGQMGGDVREPEQDHVGTGGPQPPDRRIDLVHQAVRVDLAAQDVVASRGEAHQAGPHGQRGADLLGKDLVEHLAADGEVGITEVGARVDGEPGSHQVGPSAIGAVGIGVVHALGEAVSQRHEIRPGHGRPPPLASIASNASFAPAGRGGQGDAGYTG